MKMTISQKEAVKEICLEHVVFAGPVVNKKNGKVSLWIEPGKGRAGGLVIIHNNGKISW